MLFVGALNALVVFLALAVLLRQVGDWNVKVWATTLQFLGMLVASGGLLYAYRSGKGHTRRCATGPRSPVQVRRVDAWNGPLSPRPHGLS
jgi:hypothetical protein